MLLPSTDVITETIEDVITQEPSELGESLAYACRMDDGDTTTLEFSTHIGEDTIMVSWYVPIRLTDPVHPIVPDDVVTGETDGLPVTNQWEVKTQLHHPTTADELGVTVSKAGEEIRQAVADLEYPTSHIDVPYVMSVQTNGDDPYCTLITAVTIE